jgi:hypothetical protein
MVSYRYLSCVLLNLKTSGRMSFSEEIQNQI